MSEAPETDAELMAIKSVCKNEYMLDTMADFARKLERERNEAREKAERYRLEANSFMLQRDQARKLADEFHQDQTRLILELKTK